MRRHFHQNDAQPGTCGIEGNPLCFGPEHSPNNCHEFSCWIPGTPTDVTAVINGTSAVISFKAPEDLTGVDFYNAGDVAGGAQDTNFLRAQGKASPITVPGIIPGVAYQFVVVAFNTKTTTGPQKFGVMSKPSNVVGIPLPPSANSVRPSPPTISGVEPGLSKGEVYVSFELFNVGGSPVTGFSTTCHTYDKKGVDASASGLTSPLTVKGLIPGSLYQCSVQATNKYGTSSIDSHSLSKPVKAP